ncbi:MULTISPECIES: cytochrome ubiquinol oxidase subunit I [Selenomonas]|uniref:Cytochrome ubiquinol oxidase subunit I n=1 Tax=Selenomonas ruminis TaxID=2593411 RepID=A0A5D6W726_9FIRM|nr:MULTISPECIES: cytochrome ubiquinol oxidase subunit I [unclassified Selenomonas]MBQ1867586.1 cytochrome ubiquinol oxidase subunit I [Selenomonas sp.]TYZ22524.1 cytochrome ubiquinol oxidase subunit I [Selenomonas sp. mPRGC5]
MDALLLSRWQFAITTTYHFLFVPITLGLSIFVALLETCFVMTKRPHWKAASKRLVRFFGTIFLINFALGVVTGIVQEFHFGMNWSEYSRFMGDIFGAPLALEALTAFFLESTFLGIWVFGWNKLSEKLHCACIWIVAIGSNLSAFWILVANSFMQHPAGFAIENGRAVMTDFLALVTNPYVCGEYSHALFAGISTGGFVVLAISAWKLLHDEASRYAFTQSLKGGAIFMAIGLLGVMGSGHMHTQYLATANPMKLSSIEALWETADPAPFAIAADVNMEKSRNDAEIAVPGVFSFMLYNKPSGEVRGINAIQKEYQTKYGPGDYRPDVPALFWSFRIMVGAGGFMLLLALGTALLSWKGRILSFPLLLKILPFLLPLPFLANSTGWFITEAGRQPWIVVGLQRTAEAISPNLTACSVWLTLIGFTVLYLLLILAALYIAFRHIKNTTIPDEGRDL